jgi:hypothetical protein
LFLACFFFAAVCSIASIMIWMGRGPVLTSLGAVAVLLTICFLLSVVVDSHRRASTTGGVITADAVEARQGDGPNYPPSFKDPLHAGTEFELRERRPGWFHIELSDGTDTWIPDHTADLI